MFIQGNKLGLLMFVTCGLVVIASLIMKLPDVVGMVGVGSALFFMDIIVRLRSRDFPNWLLNKDIGGYLYFIPAWVGGLVVIAINILSRILPS